MNDLKKLDSKGFIFLGADHRPYRCSMIGDEAWLHWWHPDKKWVTMRPVSQTEIWSMPRNLTDAEQELYRPDWEKNNKQMHVDAKSNFCVCGQVKHVGFDECIDCIDERQ
jgi:hypothetical protein